MSGGVRAAATPRRSVAETAGWSAAAQQALAQIAVVAQRESDVGMRQRDTTERFLAMAVLSAVGAQELPPRRRVEVELLDGHRGSRRERGRLRHPDLAAVDLDAPRVRLVLRTRSEAQP